MLLSTRMRFLSWLKLGGSETIIIS
uniref:Uncharacterized protein n=1 Tax=Rhizophora mucronata TaxID=61149 RepID=A0A2P2NWM2_RHIMU